jgi:hypothetical protein
MNRRASRYMKAFKAAADAGVAALASEYSEDVKRLHEQGTAIASGRTYWTFKGFHQASAPDDPPAQFTDALFKGIGSSRVSILKHVSGVGGDAKAYAQDLEYGSKDRNLEPRPMWRPALKQFKSKVTKILVDKVRERL